MNARSSSSAPTRPHATSPATLALRSSTAGWFAEWKARKSAPATAAAPQSAEPAPAPAPTDDAAAAVARWLTGGTGK